LVIKTKKGVKKMEMKEKAGFCPICDKKKLFRAKGTNHLFHIIMCLLTGGFWGVVYVWVSVVKKKYRCSDCGTLLDD
jgi:hypothetical protein